MAVNINNLGVRIDGWADTVEGAGAKVESARLSTEQVLKRKNMPNTNLNLTSATTDTLGNRQRNFLLVEMPNGAIATVYIGPFGEDLYAAWDLYIRPVLNSQLIYILVGIAAVIGLIGAAGSRNSFTGASSFSLIGWITGTIGWSIGFGVLVALAGLVMKRNPFYYFFKQLGVFEADDITAMGLTVHKGLLCALDGAGIDSKLLRIKEQFHGGSRERLI